MSQTIWYIQQFITSIFFLLGVMIILRLIVQLLTKFLFARGVHMKFISKATLWVSIIFLTILSVWFQILMMENSQGIELINFWILLQLYVTIHFNWRSGFLTLLANIVFQIIVAGNAFLTIPMIIALIVFQSILTGLVALWHRKRLNIIIFHLIVILLVSEFYLGAIYYNALTPGPELMTVNDAIFYSVTFILLDWTTNFTLSQFNAEDLYVNTILQQATTDWLTSLNNYGSFVEQLARNFKHWQDTNEPLSMIALDIDHFKILNDSYGHLTGNRVLAEISETMASVISKEPGAKCFRVGGDEFNIILPECELQHAGSIAELLKNKLNKLTFISVDGDELIVTLSIGVATAGLGDISPDSFYVRADKMLYHSKAHGPNHLTVQNNEF